MSEELPGWLQDALPRNREGMTGCQVFTQLWDPKLLEDPLAVLQTGLAVLLDKPMYFVVPPGMKILLPENLRRLARAVLEADIGTKRGREETARWLKEQIDRHNATEMP
jgi:hypothetical protein